MAKPSHSSRFKAHNEAIAKLMAERAKTQSSAFSGPTKRAPGLPTGYRAGEPKKQTRAQLAQEQVVNEMVQKAQAALRAGQALGEGTVEEEPVPTAPVTQFVPPPKREEPTPTDIEQNKKLSAKEKALKELEERYRKMAESRNDED